MEDLVRAAVDGGCMAVANAATALSLKIRSAVPVDAPGLTRTACLVRAKHRYHSAAAVQIWDALHVQSEQLGRRLQSRSFGPTPSTGRAK